MTIQEFEIVPGVGVEIHSNGSIQLAGYGRNFILQRQLEQIKEAELAPVIFLHHAQHRFGEFDRPLAPPRIMLRHYRLHTLPTAEPDYPGQVLRLVVGEPVQGHDRFNAEEPGIIDVFGEVAQASLGGESTW